MIGLFKPPYLLHLNNTNTFLVISKCNQKQKFRRLLQIYELNKLEHLTLRPTCNKGETRSTTDTITKNPEINFVKSHVCENGFSE